LHWNSLRLEISRHRFHWCQLEPPRPKRKGSRQRSQVSDNQTEILKPEKRKSIPETKLYLVGAHLQYRPLYLRQWYCQTGFVLLESRKYLGLNLHLRTARPPLLALSTLYLSQDLLRDF